MHRTWNNGMMEYWNVDFKENFPNKPLPYFSRTHYSIIPVFHYSNCEAKFPHLSLFGIQLDDELFLNGHSYVFTIGKGFQMAFKIFLFNLHPIWDTPSNNSLRGF